MKGKKRNLVKIAVGVTALVVPLGLFAVTGAYVGNHVRKHGVRRAARDGYYFAVEGYVAVRERLLDICYYPFRIRQSGRFKKPSELEQSRELLHFSTKKEEKRRCPKQSLIF